MFPARLHLRAGRQVLQKHSRTQFKLLFSTLESTATLAALTYFPTLCKSMAGRHDEQRMSGIGNFYLDSWQTAFTSHQGFQNWAHVQRKNVSWIFHFWQITKRKKKKNFLNDWNSLYKKHSYQMACSSNLPSENSGIIHLKKSLHRFTVIKSFPCGQAVCCHTSSYWNIGKDRGSRLKQIQFKSLTVWESGFSGLFGDFLKSLLVSYHLVQWDKAATTTPSVLIGWQHGF